MSCLGTRSWGCRYCAASQGNLDEALQFGEEGLSAALKAGGELSTGAGMAYENVAVIHRVAGRSERALPLFRKARFIYEQTIGLANPIFASLLSQEGLALLDEGERTLAEKDMLQAVDTLAKLGPACEFRLAVAESNLGLLRLHQRKFAEAERLLTHALSLEERLSSKPVADMATTMGVLAELRKAQRRDAESAQLRSRAANYRAAGDRTPSSPAPAGHHNRTSDSQKRTPAGSALLRSSQSFSHLPGPSNGPSLAPTTSEC